MNSNTVFFLDTEFIEDGKTIDLISIGITSLEGREYYAISTEFNPRKASQWVKENVLNNLPSRDVMPPIMPGGGSPREWEESKAWKSRGQIRDDILNFTSGHEGKIEFWGEWCSYDWVVFCQLFGTMMDLPEGFPMRCRDIIQYAEDHLRIPSIDLPKSLETDGNHNALLGARTVKERFCWLKWGRNGWSPNSQGVEVNGASSLRFNPRLSTEPC